MSTNGGTQDAATTSTTGKRKRDTEASTDDSWQHHFGGELGLSLVIPSLEGKDAVGHSETAIDYEDEDELAEEELLDGVLDEQDQLFGETRATDAAAKSDDDDDDWAKEFAEELRVKEEPKEYDELGDLFSHTAHDHEGDINLETSPGSDGKSSPSVQAQAKPSPEGDKTTGGDLLLDDLEELDEDGPLDSKELGALEDEYLLRTWFPSFRKNEILNMNALFGAPPVRPNLPRPKFYRLCVPLKANLEVDTDQARIFRLSHERIPPRDPHLVKIDLKLAQAQRADEPIKTRGVNDENVKLDRELALACFDWNDEDIINPSKSAEAPPYDTVNMVKRQRLLGSEPKGEDYAWSEDISAILEGDLSNYSHLTMDLSDPHLLLDVIPNDESGIRKRQALKSSALEPRSVEQTLKRRYNVSNDAAYDLLKENYSSRVRSTLGTLSIEHSMVAKRLQSPFYKVSLSKSQARAFHRPTFVVRPNSTIHFSKLKTRKKKKDRGKDVSQILSTTKDLTLGDTAPFFLFEYSEEFPMPLSNVGMGSKLINYYRKKDADDQSRPKRAVGETHVLNPQDRSPFWNFGFVRPGEIVPTLYNNMTRAPVFQHEPKNTDFLLVRSSGGGMGQRYFLRPIPYLFTVGQMFPVTEVPGPHSRRVTTASKNRLKMIVFRVLHKNDRLRLLVKDISAHFPNQNDMQNRQRLKEFMEYQRTGDDQTYWKLKPTDILPSEEVIRSMISPEEIALIEVMQVGQQHLEDAGYGKSVEEDEYREGMSAEEQLAPWIVTRNFINATQGKAMLHLHGEGDPTGRGEGLSFIRTSMKGGFRAQGESVDEKIDKSKYGGHSYNVALQQKAYEEEIERVWNGQKRALSIEDESQIPWEMDVEEHNRQQEIQRRTEAEDIGGLFGETKSSDLFRESPGPRDDESASQFSHASSSTRHKILRIIRTVKNANGSVEKVTELVKDPAVIRAYLTRKHMEEDANLEAEKLAPTNDEEVNRRHQRFLQEELARLKRNEERRQARKQMKANQAAAAVASGGQAAGRSRSVVRDDGSVVSDGQGSPAYGLGGSPPGTPFSGDGVSAASHGKATKTTTRKCATCGQVGHIRTNKACPKYNERFGAGGESPAAPAEERLF